MGWWALYSDDFEKAFSDFLERREYDQASNALFSIVRIAFVAGWKAAGGAPPPPQKVIELVRLDLSTTTENDIETDLRVSAEQDGL